jgi:hypothetical protein
MIKLTDLIDELELRKGTLKAPKTDVGRFFFEDYELGAPNTRVWAKKLNDNFYNYIDKNSKVVAKAGSFKLLRPTELSGHYFLVNEVAREEETLNNLNGYLAGFIDADVLSIDNRNLAPFQMKGIEIHLTFIFEGYRGMGLGTIMYQLLLQAYKTVFSDSILYEGSRAVWVDKLAPMANGSNIIFGGQSSKVIVPLSQEDAKNNNLMTFINRYFLTTNPPAELKKIARAVNGLSLSTGEYAIYEPTRKLSANDLDRISDQSDSIQDLINKANLAMIVGIEESPNLKKIIIETDNAVMVSDDLGDVELI